MEKSRIDYFCSMSEFQPDTKAIDRQKLLFIINPVSGVRKRSMEDFKKLISSKLDQSKFIADLRLTASSGHAGRIAEEGLEEGIHYIVAVGGDGTINEVGEKLKGTDAVMGIIPGGSGNGLAHHLGIPTRMKAAIEVLNRCKVEKIDTCMADEVFFVSIAGIGFDAKVARQFASSKRRGFMTYALIAFKEYFRYKSREYELLLDGKQKKVSAFFISFANSNQFGYNARIAPKASLMDGKIDVCVVRKPPVQAFPGIVHLMFRRKIDHSKYMATSQASDVIVKRKKGKTVNIDGEPIKMGKEIHLRILPASLNVIVP